MKNRIPIILTFFAVFLILSILGVCATGQSLVPKDYKIVTVMGSGDSAVARVDVVHYASTSAPAKNNKGPVCYSLLGVKWKDLPIKYTINPSNSGLNQSFVTSAISNAAETWDAATPKKLFKNAYSINYSSKYGVRDGVNSLSFGSYNSTSIAAVTSMWYKVKTKEIFEFDVLFNTDFPWGDATNNPNVLDLQEIATHELGHGIGFDDIYDPSCSAVTMYGLSYYGDTSQRTLEQPDITGLLKMYR